MSASEIDDIFSGVVKSVSKSAETGLSSSKSTLSKSQIDERSSSKKKKAKKRKREEANDGAQSTVVEVKGSTSAAHEVGESKVKSKKSKRIVQTIVDPSLAIEYSTASLPTKVESNSKSKSKSVPKRPGKDNKDDIQRFKDSRGTGPSTSTPLTFFRLSEITILTFFRTANRGRFHDLQGR